MQLIIDYQSVQQEDNQSSQQGGGSATQEEPIGFDSDSDALQVQPKAQARSGGKRVSKPTRNLRDNEEQAQVTNAMKVSAAGE